MRRTSWSVVGILFFLLGLGLLVKGAALQVPTGTWAPGGAMGQPRAGASAARLQDGRVLITGGNGASGALATAEFFNADGTIASAPPMNTARSRHISIALQDGRVLLAGGETTGGGVTNAAEIFDPVGNTWTNVTGGMLEARAGHTASLLSDGRVLVAAGEGSGTVSSTLEIFDPAQNTFNFAGALSSPRKNHAAAVLADGRVLIVGGSNGTDPLASSDIYDSVAGSVSPGPALSTPRQGHSATTVLTGNVLVAGGNNGSVDLASAEILDSSAGTFSAISSALATPRQGHLAFLLPNNNNVLIVGGTSAGAPLASAELFTPWQGTFAGTGSLSTARSDAAGSALKQDGLLLVASGEDASGTSLSSTDVYGFATVKTDQADYTPGTTVIITGTGWQPGETVTLSLVEVPLIDTHGPYTAVADSAGNIFFDQFAVNAADAGLRFYLTATGSVSRAQTTFTDANPGSFNVSPNNYSYTLNPGQAIPSGTTFTYTVTVGTRTVTFPVTASTSVTGATWATLDKASISIASDSGSDAVTVSGTVPCGQTAGLITLHVKADLTNNNGNPPALTPSSLSKPVNITVTSTPDPSCSVSNTIKTSPAGLQVSIDGGAAQTAPVTVSWIPGSSHTIATTSPQSGGAGTQYVWTSWSDGGAISHSVTGPSTPTTYTANFKTQYQVTFDASSNVKGDSSATIVTVDGSAKAFGVLPFSKFVDSGGSAMYAYASPVASTAAPTTTQYRWDTTSGLSQTLQSNTFTVSGPGTVTANYVAQHLVTFDQAGIGADVYPMATVVTVNASTKVFSSPHLFSDWFDIGSSVTYAYSSPVASTVTGKRYILTGSAPSPSSPFTVSMAITVTATYKAQYDTTMVVVSSANPSILAQSVYFTATVTAQGGGPTPTGSVQFKIDGANFGSPVTLIGGSATSTSTSTLSVGMHPVEADYSPDTDSFTNSVGMLSGGQQVQYKVCLLYDPTRSVKSGATYPLKLYLCNVNGNDISTSSIVVHAFLVTSVSGFSGPPEDSGNANPDYDFRFDITLGPSGGYIYNFQTTGLAGGTYSLHFNAGNDPIPHTASFGVK